jgi:hypothetical protein
MLQILPKLSAVVATRKKSLSDNRQKKNSSGWNGLKQMQDIKQRIKQLQDIKQRLKQQHNGKQRL